MAHPRAVTIKRLGILARKMRWVHKNARHLFDQDVLGAPECGTPGCTGGWLQTLPSYKASGSQYWINFLQIYPEEDNRLFGIVRDSGIRTPLQSAKNIEKLIAEIKAT